MNLRDRQRLLKAVSLARKHSSYAKAIGIKVRQGELCSLLHIGGLVDIVLLQQFAVHIDGAGGENEKIFPVKMEKTLDFLGKVDIIIYALARYSGFV